VAQLKRQITTDQRRTPRRVYVRPIGVLCLGQYEVQQALQLSESGVLFQSSHKFEVKDQVVASLVLPGDGVVVARGEITSERSEANGNLHQYGIKFVPLPLHLRRWIRNYVAAKTQEEAEAEDSGDIGI
jgi:hypothetical protein